jgi:hypothetical protein
MRSILLSVTWLLFPFVMVGCAGWGGSQQPGLQIPESGGFFIVHPQGLFFTPMALTLMEGVDGVVRVHAAAPPVHLFSDPVSGPGPAQLNAALRPFLFPSCDVHLPVITPR